MTWRRAIALATFAVAGLAFAPAASASQPKFEPEGGTFPVTFSGTGGAGTLETVPDGTKVRVVKWVGNTISGEINSSTTLRHVVLTFTGATATGPFGSNVACTGPGLSSGEFVTTSLKGMLVYVKAGSSEVGIDLQPESGTAFAEFTCGGLQKFVISGSVIGKLTPVNSLTNSFTLTFTESAGKQSPESSLSPTGCTATKDVLSAIGTAVGFGGENFGPLQIGFAKSESLTTSKKMKVAASSCV